VLGERLLSLRLTRVPLGERGAQRPRWLVRARQRPIASVPRPHLCPLTAFAPCPLVIVLLGLYSEMDWFILSVCASHYYSMVAIFTSLHLL
jgi:hypothetical protein